MVLALKQFVPSHVCLKCEGCCRFQSADSAWRPRAIANISGSGDRDQRRQWDKKDFVDDKNYVTTIVDCGKHLCRFLNKTDSTCRVYADRPFECALYPFLLSRGTQGIDVYVHLACPHIQETEHSPEFNAYVGYLKEFFTKEETIQFLKNNTHLLGDYTPYLQEMLHVFRIQVAL